MSVAHELQAVPSSAIVPTAGRASVFESHRRLLMPTALLFHTAAVLLPFFLTAPGLMIGSLSAAALGSVVGLGATFGLLSRGALIGNTRLERRLRSKLMAQHAGGLTFVGVCALENNTLERRIRRFETDDNVGLLAVTDDRLVVLMEGGRIELARSDVTSVGLEPLPDYPKLAWVRIDFDADHRFGGFLLMSREAQNLSGIRTETEALYRRLVDWHAESQLAWLAAHRG